MSCADSGAIQIGSRSIGSGHPCYVIAEVGVNHNGDPKLAEKLIELSAQAGVDAVKFQSFKVSELIVSNVTKAPYQTRTSDAKESQTAMLERLAVGDEFHKEMMQLCNRHDVTYISTPYDVGSMKFLLDAGCEALKIASTDANNLWFLEEVARCGVPVILSTGMTTLGEMQESYRCLKDGGLEQLALLKCTSAYPTQPDDVHLSAMQTLKQIFPVPIGFSDHTPGVGSSPYAVALGACIVEKHVTLDRSLPGPDHAASIEPDELAELVREIRRVESMLGDPLPGPTAVEATTRQSLQRCLVAASSLAVGTELTRETVRAKRTGAKGIPASRWLEVKGQRLTAALEPDQALEWRHLQQA